MTAAEYEAAGARFDAASAAYPIALAVAARILREAEDEWEAARANLARFERSPGIPLPEHDPLRTADLGALVTAWTPVPRLQRIRPDGTRVPWPAGPDGLLKIRPEIPGDQNDAPFDGDADGMSARFLP